MTETVWLDIFGDVLRIMLEEAEMTQSSLAELSGVSQSSISDYIHKKKMPTIKSVINIADALGCSIEELVDFGDRIE